jgi:hypothetical protein
VVTSFLLNHDFNIVEHHHFDDHVRELLFLRTTFAPSSCSTSTILRGAVQLHCQKDFSMRYAFYDETKPRVLGSGRPGPTSRTHVGVGPVVRAEISWTKWALTKRRSPSSGAGWFVPQPRLQIGRVRARSGTFACGRQYLCSPTFREAAVDRCLSRRSILCLACHNSFILRYSVTGEAASVVHPDGPHPS